MSMVRAIYEAGVFRPLTPPELPEGAEVEFEVHVVPAGDIPPLSDVYSESVLPSSTLTWMVCPLSINSLTCSLCATRRLLLP